MTHQFAPLEHRTIRVGTLPFIVTDLKTATRDIISYSESRTGIAVRLANAYCVAQASDNSSYAEMMSKSGIIYPDGRPVVWFMQLRNRGSIRPKQVRGPSLFNSVLDLGRGVDLQHFFLGTDENTLERLRISVAVAYPGVSVAGSFAPPYAPISSIGLEEMTARILRVKPDLVWVALGTPKQDFVATELAARVSVPVVAVGAAFDFAAGTQREAPVFMRLFALEWLFRLVSEPKRLWRRYTVDILTFLRAAVLQSSDPYNTQKSK